MFATWMPFYFVRANTFLKAMAAPGRFNSQYETQRCNFAQL